MPLTIFYKWEISRCRSSINPEKPTPEQLVERLLLHQTVMIIRVCAYIKRSLTLQWRVVLCKKQKKRRMKNLKWHLKFRFTYGLTRFCSWTTSSSLLQCHVCAKSPDVVHIWIHLLLQINSKEKIWWTCGCVLPLLLYYTRKKVCQNFKKLSVTSFLLWSLAGAETFKAGNICCRQGLGTEDGANEHYTGQQAPPASRTKQSSVTSVSRLLATIPGKCS